MNPIQLVDVLDLGVDFILDFLDLFVKVPYLFLCILPRSLVMRGPFLGLDDAYEIECVLYQIGLDFEVQWGLECERWGEVDLEEPGIHVVVEQDVVAEELIAVVSPNIALFDLLFRHIFNTQQTLDYNIVDLAPHKVYVDAIFFEMLLHGAEAPLEPAVVICSVFILNVIFILFVD